MQTVALLLLLVFASTREANATFRCRGRIAKARCRRLKQLGLPRPNCCQKYFTKAPTKAPVKLASSNPPVIIVIPGVPKAPTPDLPSAPTEPPKPPTNPPKQPTNPPKRPTNSPKQPTNAPKPPTKAPKNPTKAPRNPPTLSTGSSAGVYGDPHLVTFDGLQFECQGYGEYVLYAAEPSGGRVHARFAKKGRVVSLATAVAAQGDRTAPLVQVVASNDTNVFDLFVGANKLNASDGFTNSMVQVSRNDRVMTIAYSNGLSVSARYIGGAFPHLAITVQRPSTGTGADTDIQGLLGNADGDATNDWMDRTGTNVTQAGNRGKPAFDYCTRTWCVSNATESMFALSSFNASGCNETFPGAVNQNSISPALRALCGTNQACIIDGLELGLDGARDVLRAEAELASLVSTRLTISPTSILVNQSTIVTFTVNLTGLNASDLVESFRLRRVDPMSPNTYLDIDPRVLLYLEDKEANIGWSDKSIAGDAVYSGSTSLLSKVAGEVFAFRAVHYSLGEVVPSPYTITSLNAVRSYSMESGLVPKFPKLSSRPVLQVNSTENLAVFFEVTSVRDHWHQIYALYCLENGRNCRSDDGYLTYLYPDRYSTSFRYEVGRSLNDSLRTNTTVKLEQYWYISASSGPVFTDLVSLRVSTGQEYANGTAVSDNNMMELSYKVGSSSHSTGSINQNYTTIWATIVRASNGSATIQLSSSDPLL